MAPLLSTIPEVEGWGEAGREEGPELSAEALLPHTVLVSLPKESEEYSAVESSGNSAEVIWSFLVWGAVLQKARGQRRLKALVDRLVV